MIYTDGLTELENDLGEEYGIERLSEFIFKNAKLDVNEIIDNIKKDMDDFRGEQEFNDDVSILLNRFF